jgi:molybdate transport system substrate-binding protein
MAVNRGRGAGRHRPGRWIAAIACAVLAAPLTAASDSPGPQHAPLVAAASDLQFALDEIAAQFERDTGIRTRVSYGASGTFARQIEQGAPFELFLSADESFVLRLQQRGLTRDAGTLYALGRLVIFAPRGSPMRADPALESLKRRLAEGGFGRFAIANPEHAPYGRAAEQVLRRLGVWNDVQSHLVIGENVAQATQFASDGNAEGGLIAHSLALAPELRRRGSYAMIPAELHEPLRQRMVLLRNATPEARRLYEYLVSPAGRGVLERFGFSLPGD